MSTAVLPKRQLGSTGLHISVLGFGASPLGGAYNADGVIDPQRAKEAVHEAFRLGMNFFDTSPYYGNTKSETVLGQCLQGLPRDQIVLASKVGQYGDKQFDFSAARVTASVTESLERLQTSYLDIVQCHDIEFASLDQVITEALPALLVLKQRGLVRHIGITGLPLEAFRHVLDRVPAGTVDSVLSYCHNCLNDTTLLGMMPYLHERGVGVISASPLSMGLLTRSGPPAWHPAPPHLRDACAAAAVAAAEVDNVDLSRLALQQCVKCPDIASTLVGMSTPEEVRANVQYALEGLGLLPLASPAEAEALTRALREVERILAPVRDVTWPSGRPENS